MKVFIAVLPFLFGFAVCGKSGPYPASGWKPQGARLELPKEYGAPFVRLNGQINQFTTNYPTTTTEYETTTYDRGYLPPTTTEYPEEAPPINPLRVQGLPKENLKLGKFSELDDFKTQFFASQYQLQFGVEPKFGQLKAQSVGRLENARDLNSNPEEENGYLPPEARAVNGNQEVESVVQNSEDDSEAERQVAKAEETEEVSEDGQVSEPQGNGAHFQGQYFILAPDNTLQRVMFKTVQTEDDIRNHGFTAQLNYAPVDPVKPPVYGYNEQGQLIRLLK